MNNNQWAPIDQFSDAALRRMAADSKDLRCGAARRELDRRLVQLANDIELNEMHIAALDDLHHARTAYADIERELRIRGSRAGGILR